MRLSSLAAALLAATALSQPGAAAEPLKLERVVLTQAGISLFDYAAEITDSGEVVLDLRRDQLDDALKTLTVSDGGGGRVGAIRFAAEASEELLARDLPFPPAALASLPEFLKSVTGAEVSFGAVRGRLMAVDELERGDQGKTWLATLATADGGLKTVLLEEAGEIRFVDPALTQALNRLLGRRAQAGGAERRRLTIALAGTGKRAVRVGVQLDMPLWKLSWRLVAGADGNARLQGWAVVENLSGQDWKDVALTLASGAPVTFRQALARPVLVPRPEIPVELPGQSVPAIDRGSFDAPRSRAAPPPPQAPATRSGQQEFAAVAGMMAPAPVMAAPKPGAPPPAEPEEQAETEAAAAQTLYHLPQKVTLAAGEAASLPLIDRNLPAGLVLHRPLAHRGESPLLAVRLRNEGATLLPPGAVAVYEMTGAGLTMLGDARMGPVPPGESRLLAVAQDRGVRILAESTTPPRTSVTATAARGVMRLSWAERQTTLYRVANRGPARDLVLDHPRPADSVLVQPTQASVIDGGWRLTVPLAANTGTDIQVIQENKRWREVLISSLDANDTQINALLAGVNFLPSVRKSFEQVAAMRSDLAGLRTELARLEATRLAETKEQERIRANLQAVPKDSAAAKDYLARLAKSEAVIDKATQDAAALRIKVNEATDKLAAVIDALKF